MPEPFETRSQVFDFLASRINYERTTTGKYSAREFKLERMGCLLELLGNPQDRLPAVHVAGTKGKGSTSVMIAEMLSAAGYRTGLFTSPHVSEFEERMRVDGVQPSGGELAALANAVRGQVAEMDRSPQGMRPTYFEIATAMAWLYFIRRRAELVVLEVGLGGRLDATNLCRPEATVITNVSRDHTQVLGNRLAQIAREKGGIIKPNVPLFSGVAGEKTRAVVLEICSDRNAPLYELGREIRLSGRTVCRGEPSGNGRLDTARAAQRIDVSTPWRTWSDVPVTLAGEHQARNAALALSAVDLLDHLGCRISPAAVHRGMSRVECPLRIEVLGDRPLVVLDAAHNTAAAAALIQTLNSEFPSSGRRILVFAATEGKDVGGLLKELTPHFETIVLTRYVNNPRGIPAEELAAAVQRCGRPAVSAADPAEAWKLASKLAGPDDLICVTGSFFLAAEVRELICGRAPGGERVTSSRLTTKTPAGRAG